MGRYNREVGPGAPVNGWCGICARATRRVGSFEMCVRCDAPKTPPAVPPPWTK